MKPVQLIYFNERPWYGVSLMAQLLGPAAKLTHAKNALPDRGAPAILFSFLAAREYQKLFTGFDYIKIPYLSKNRGKSYPLLIAGGGAMMNPEPIANFFDIICIGDGEQWAETIRAAVLAEKDRDYLFGALAELPGAYIPSRRSVEYDAGGIRVKSITGDTAPIAPAVTLDLPRVYSGIGGSNSVEIARSCASKCTFCSIGWTAEYREYPLEYVNELLSLPKPPVFWASNMGGVSYLQEIHNQMRLIPTGEDVRIDSFLAYPEPKPGDYEKNRFTFGLEGINERLRAILGKYIPDSDVGRYWENISRTQTSGE